MDKLKMIVSALEHMLSNKRQRHIIGGILLSASIFFGALALTAMLVK